MKEEITEDEERFNLLWRIKESCRKKEAEEKGGEDNMRIIENQGNIRAKCIKSIGEIAVVQVEMGDEEGTMESIDTLMSLVPKSTADLIAQMSSEELNVKIDHILGWLHPLIERLEKEKE